MPGTKIPLNRHYMAIKATVFKVALQIADMDLHHYADHALTLARHPSETDERMMVRLIAFALFANDALLFGKGLSSDEEPDLWRKDLTGAIELWIQVGLPDERVIRKASGRATGSWSSATAAPSISGGTRIATNCGAW